MATPTTIAAAILRTALNPKVVSTDKSRVESHDIEPLLAAERHEAGVTAATRDHFGVRFTKIIAPRAG